MIELIYHFIFVNFLQGVLRTEGNTTTIEEELVDAYNESEMSCEHDSSYAVDFCYWLQGAYELFPEFVLQKSALFGSVQFLSNVIKDEHEKYKTSPAYLFCIFLDGVVESGGDLGIVKQRLAKVFYHQIDKEYPNYEELSMFHNPPQAAKLTDSSFDLDKIQKEAKPQKTDQDEDAIFQDDDNDFEWENTIYTC